MVVSSCAMLRREAAARYPQRYCTFADGCCAADAAMAPESGRTLGSLASSNAELVSPRPDHGSGKELSGLSKGAGSGVFVCCGWRAGEGDHVAQLVATGYAQLGIGPVQVRTDRSR
jgi:hypothetical protein